MHPDTEKAMSGPRRSALKSSDQAKGLLGPPTDVPFSPALQPALSNISGDTDVGYGRDPAYTAYEKCKDPDENSSTDRVSFPSLMFGAKTLVVQAASIVD